MKGIVLQGTPTALSQIICAHFHTHCSVVSVVERADRSTTVRCCCCEDNLGFFRAFAKSYSVSISSSIALSEGTAGTFSKSCFVTVFDTTFYDGFILSYGIRRFNLFLLPCGFVSLQKSQKPVPRKHLLSIKR